MKSKNGGEDLIDYQGSDMVISSYQLQEEFAKRGYQEKKFMSKIPSLDKYTEGFGPGNLVVISGPTKAGKTLLCQTLTDNFVKQQILSLWFTFEVIPIEFFKRFPTLPLFYLPKEHKKHAIKWLEERIKEAKQKYEIDIVFIDHLHYLARISGSRYPSLYIGDVTRELKMMALKNEICIFLVAHMRKTDNTNPPSANDIRDSSFIVQDCDKALVVWRKTNDVNQTFLKIDCDRQTGVIDKVFKMRKVNGLLREVINDTNGK
jgi:replicative DNA helicase